MGVKAELASIAERSVRDGMQAATCKKLVDIDCVGDVQLGGKKLRTLHKRA